MHDNSLTLGNRRRAKGLWALGRSRVVLGHRAEAKPSSQRERAHKANRWIVECMWTEHFSSSGIGKARAGNRDEILAHGRRGDRWVVEPRSEPDSGKPTVRDRRGAWRNVAMAELGTHSVTERAGLETLRLKSAHSSSIPTLQERRERIHLGPKPCG
jgi:hypothetical protein